MTSSGPGRLAANRPSAVEQRFERGPALTADDQHMFQRRQVRADGVRHRFVPEAAIFPRDHQHFRFRLVQHESHLPLPEDRHHRVGDGAQPQRRQVQRDELPPVRQLHRHHVAAPDTKPRQAGGDPIDLLRQRRIGQRCGCACHAVVVHDRDAVGRCPDPAIEVVQQRAVRPQAGRCHCPPPRLRQNGMGFQGSAPLSIWPVCRLLQPNERSFG